ncbi:hypothetical protein [Xenorhabdus japonica]|uniref:Uncharacterized protein n=1 Tax=Xenorhabdus japonica TaxID=53341 RepID=A0A1I5EHS3_9GAMM|nr:hypothetical protein [Xenorhabdus japonica]SFO10876.1 hypothetical protein SAMN05421579_1708 [Xenorhabdus japonica]
MKRLAKVLFSFVLVSLPFSGHSFQAPTQEKNTHQILGIKIPSTPKPPRPPKTPKKHGTSGIKHTYKSIKDAPQYPKEFINRQNGTTKRPMGNSPLLAELRRDIEPGKWYKVYKDGLVNGQKVSIHYFESKSGQVFNVKVIHGWSNKI